MILQVRSITKENLPDVCRLGARAFRNYPLYTLWDGNLREGSSLDAFLFDFHRVFFPALSGHAVCRVVECDGKPAGSFILEKPDVKEAGVLQYVMNGGVRMLRHATLHSLLRFIRMTDDTLQGVPPMRNGHWHVHYLAVDPAFQGRGIGSAILSKQILPFVCRQGGKLLTLTTNAEDNVRLYEGNGFSVTHDYPVRCFGKEIYNWVLAMDEISCYNQKRE